MYIIQILWMGTGIFELLTIIDKVCIISQLWRFNRHRDEMQCNHVVGLAKSRSIRLVLLGLVGLKSTSMHPVHLK